MTEFNKWAEGSAHDTPSYADLFREESEKLAPAWGETEPAPQAGNTERSA